LFLKLFAFLFDYEMKNKKSILCISGIQTFAGNNIFTETTVLQKTENNLYKNLNRCL